MTLRLATEEDIPAIKRMSYLFYDHSPYSSFEIDDEKVTALTTDILKDKTKNIVILSCQPDPVGMIVGLSNEFMFNRKKIAMELLWWMDPEYRKSRDAIKLVEAYEYWATNVAKADIVQLSLLTTEQAPQIEKFYSRRGYKLSEKSFFKKVN